MWWKTSGRKDRAAAVEKHSRQCLRSASKHLMPSTARPYLPVGIVERVEGVGLSCADAIPGPVRAAGVCGCGGNQQLHRTPTVRWTAQKKFAIRAPAGGGTRRTLVLVVLAMA